MAYLFILFTVGLAMVFLAGEMVRKGFEEIREWCIKIHTKHKKEATGC